MPRQPVPHTATEQEIRDREVYQACIRVGGEEEAVDGGEDVVVEGTIGRGGLDM